VKLVRVAVGFPGPLATELPQLRKELHLLDASMAQRTRAVKGRQDACLRSWRRSVAPEQAFPAIAPWGKTARARSLFEGHIVSMTEPPLAGVLSDQVAASPCPIRTAPTTGMSRPPRLPRRPHDTIPLMHFLAFGRKTKVPSCLPGSSPRSGRPPRLMEWPGWDGPAYSSHPRSRSSSHKG
jgi:hypothetical protein